MVSHVSYETMTALGSASHLKFAAGLCPKTETITPLTQTTGGTLMRRFPPSAGKRMPTYWRAPWPAQAPRGAGYPGSVGFGGTRKQHSPLMRKLLQEAALCAEKVVTDKRHLTGQHCGSQHDGETRYRRREATIGRWRIRTCRFRQRERRMQGHVIRITAQRFLSTLRRHLQHLQCPTSSDHCRRKTMRQFRGDAMNTLADRDRCCLSRSVQTFNCDLPTLS